ncbi:MAG: GyrI-like domain-containing protein [Planctomycetes bacterium]|nr:GyrI-like domain-containing protein [Planctomycetota bacterium]
MARRTHLALLLALLPLGCRSTRDQRADSAAAWSYTPDLPVSHAPFETVHANYKERLEQLYVFVELRGTYTQTGRALPELHERLTAAGLAASGPPFGLFYDDPGKVAVAELRSRACIPVAKPPEPSTGLASDVLPRAHVVYAVVAGPYPEAPRAYPGLYAYMAKMGWVEAGPVRELYLVPPTSVRNFDALLCELQIPAMPRP